jgi:DNA gyrase inhibitor GyrI
MIEKEDKFELRKYDAYIVAATVVEGSFDDVGNEGFRRLFKYISGHNQSKKSISMTAPVSQKTISEKIPMTAPVSQEKLGGKWVITFMLPSQYNMDIAPKPLDDRIKIKEIPSRLIAVMKYSGTWSRKRYVEHESKLKNMLQKKGLLILAEPIFARYNPPFTPWFLRRNEIHIHVEQSNK